MVRNQVVWIDVERCTGCGACVKTCPVGAITLTDGKAHVDEKTCTGCGACLSVCPEEAVKPIVEGELVQAEEPRSHLPDRAPSRAPAVQRSRPLVEAAAPALAVAGAGLLAKLTRAIARAVGNW
ncbi:MAG: 4Fe-4S binding protein, partial [Anaerolineae bacterium]|nr:4Fe-4S binding protein [Anaerolineae bacterium]